MWTTTGRCCSRWRRLRRRSAARTAGFGIARCGNAGGGFRAERTLDEYVLPGLCPGVQAMDLARPLLGPDVLNSDTVQGCRDPNVVRMAGRVVRRQRPLAKAVFLTLENEWGLIPIAVWEGRWERLKNALRRPLVVIEGTISRRDNTLNMMAEQAWPLSIPY